MTADPYDIAHEAALVGTSRARAGDVEQAAAALLGPGDSGTQQWRLLELAAAVTRVQRATQTPLTTDREPVAPGPAPEREISRSTRAALDVALADATLQQEALTWLADCRLTLDADSTVAVLELATARPTLRDAATRAVGPRGAWLATHNAAWSWVTPGTTDVERWEHATLDERLAILRAVRAHDPARGRALLEQTSERADALAALVAELATNLTLDDEPYLESLLDDRRVQVRRAAAELLVTLDGSALVQRAIARATRYLHISGRLRKQLDVTPPDEPDAEMVRDAVPTDVVSGMGKSASLLLHDVSRVPPAALRNVLDLDTARLVSLAVATDWWPSLRGALAISARRWHDAELLVALLPHVPFGQLVDGLDDDAATAHLVTAELRHQGKEPPAARALQALRSTPLPWGLATARALWPALVEVLDAAQRGRDIWGLHEAARTAGRSLPVDGPPLPLDPTLYTDDSARRAADAVVTTFEIRQRLHAALRHDAQETP